MLLIPNKRSKTNFHLLKFVDSVFLIAALLKLKSTLEAGFLLRAMVKCL